MYYFVSTNVVKVLTKCKFIKKYKNRIGILRMEMSEYVLPTNKVMTIDQKRRLFLLLKLNFKTKLLTKFYLLDCIH